MYTDMEMWRDIRRRILVEGEAKRQICREYGIHFRTLQKILEHSEPPGYRQSKPREKRKIGPYLSFIEETLRALTAILARPEKTWRRFCKLLRSPQNHKLQQVSTGSAATH